MHKFLLLSLLISLPLMAVVPVPEEKTHQTTIVTPTDVKMGFMDVVCTLGGIAGTGAAVIVGTPVVPAIAVGVGFATIFSIFSGSKNTNTNAGSTSSSGRVYDENGFYKDGNGKWQNPNTAMSNTQTTHTQHDMPIVFEGIINQDNKQQTTTNPFYSKQTHQVKINRDTTAALQEKQNSTDDTDRYCDRTPPTPQDFRDAKARVEESGGAIQYIINHYSLDKDGRMEKAMSAMEKLGETFNPSPFNMPPLPPKKYEKVHWEPPHYEKEKKHPSEE